MSMAFGNCDTDKYEKQDVYSIYKKGRGADKIRSENFRANHTEPVARQLKFRQV